jgi:hypothetical protein
MARKSVRSFSKNAQAVVFILNQGEKHSLNTISSCQTLFSTVWTQSEGSSMITCRVRTRSSLRMHTSSAPRQHGTRQPMPQRLTTAPIGAA